MENDCKFLFKTILIGNSGVGKTCLMKRFTDEVFESNQTSTIGVDFKIKSVETHGYKVKIQIWDTAGQERFRAIISNYYRGAHGILIVFDLTNRDSFDNLNDWINEVRKNTSEKVEIVILGNKVDSTDRICIEDAEVEAFLTKNNIPKTSFFKTSAKDDIKVNEAFLYLANRLAIKFEKSEFSQSKKDGFKLRADSGESKGCCM